MQTQPNDPAPKPKLMRRPLSALRAFLAHEAAGGLVLMAAAFAALIVANSPLAETYEKALHKYLGPLSLQHWINDGLMAVFFLLVGLEIKREALDGALRTWPDRVLPGVAAAAGMAVPALVYFAFNAGSDTVRGWAIPAATDIAFALGVLALLGSRVPVSLKIFLAAVAIVDDLGAVLIIALFYTGTLDTVMLMAGGGVLLVLLILNRAGIRALSPYLLLGLLLWVFVLRSGVHATVAGVLLALFIPIRPSPGRPEDETSPLHRLEHALSPWVAFAIVPIFGFANAGVQMIGLPAEALVDPVTLGVALGLFLGKQVGIFASVRLAVAAGIARKPSGANWAQIYGIALFCGIGFTMSLFIGGLAFTDGLHGTETKLGVLGGSLLSALAGALVLRASSRMTKRAVISS